MSAGPTICVLCSVLASTGSSPDEVRQILDTLSELEQERGVTGQVALMPLTETARGLRDVDAVAGHPRVGVMQLGELDLAAELGLAPAPDEAELLYARSRVVTSSAAAGLLPPVAAVSPDFTDLDGYRVSTERLRRLGFVGRAVIHPAQLPVVHDVFTPAPGEVAAARRTLAAYEAALLSGSGVMTDEYGRMVDEAVVRASRRIVALARVPRTARRHTHDVTTGLARAVLEDFTVGDVYQHTLGRTVTQTDNAWFALHTQNTAPLHVDQHYASQTEFGRPLVNSAFTIALVTWQSVSDVSQNVMANLGWDEVRLPNLLFEGDTVYSVSEVLETRQSRSRPNVGIVTVLTTGYKHDGTPVITFRRTVMVYRRGRGPSIPEVTSA
ncbi:aldolase/citrate lyase family protein [Amycolatopsis sp.]|uniref:aldolase/citrate lyase family protein n=1 Tax=Amycolatopsis sp. TaxID=37632 RepID=UPI002639B047|nr:aldolase/citrate lyase family protein [Amycolatopsis sp.]